MAHPAEQSGNLGWEHLGALNESATACGGALRLQEELGYRLQIFRHPLHALQHSALRVQNLVLALRVVLAVDQDDFDAERLALSRELIEAIRSVPVSPVAPENLNDHVPSWERSMRLLLGTIDLDVVFGAPLGGRPDLPISFRSSAGAAMNIADVATRCDELDARVVFFTSASAEYFGRYAETYVSSILAACGCSCMVMICVCCPKEQLADIVSTLRIDDRRLVFCSDDFDPISHEVTTFLPTGGDPVGGAGCYYASSSLLRADILLRRLGRPIFVTGIDTVLQRGVVDLLERCRNADLVLNKYGSQGLLGCQLVNSLVLIYPTANGLLFAEFLKTYLGAHLSQPIQSAFLDQLDLHMAKHHVVAYGVSPIVGYFDELDINNVMFNRINYRSHFDTMKSFRFLNMFVGGIDDAMRLKTEDVVPENA